MRKSKVAFGIDRLFANARLDAMREAILFCDPTKVYRQLSYGRMHNVAVVNKGGVRTMYLNGTKADVILNPDGSLYHCVEEHRAGHSADNTMVATWSERLA